ncbi:unnamed protein product, partial [marine sediment metagenome]
GRAIIYSLKDRWNHLAKTFVHPGNTLQPQQNKAQNATALSTKYKGPVVDALGINLDGRVGTPIIRYDGDLKKVEFLKYDLPSLGFNLKGKGADVLIIGAGGGKDVLTSIIYGAKRIDAVEINPDVVRFVKENFAEFSGNLYNLANVNAVVIAK